MRIRNVVLIIAVIVAIGALAAFLLTRGDKAKLPETAAIGASPTLPEPSKMLLPTVHIAPAKGWQNGGKPNAASGLAVEALATGLQHPRWLYVLPNGDVLVAESDGPPRPDDGTGIKGFIYRMVQRRAGAGTPSANRITLLRAANGGAAAAKTVFLKNLNSPFGMALVGNDFYVANTDAIMRFPYREGVTAISEPGVKLADLPGGTINHHWTKNIIASRDGSRLYATVGSNSNVGENGLDKEVNRAAILEIERATGNTRLFASGLRNPNGMDWEAQTGALWTVVNERDELGSDLVPDYLTSVRDGGFYGWPFSYWGPARGQPGSAQPGFGRQGDRSRLCARQSHGLARTGVPSGRIASRAISRRRFYRAARFVESQAAERVQGDFRAVCGWPPIRPADRRAHRICGRRREGARPPGRCRHR